MSHLEFLPEPSATRVYDVQLSDVLQPQCHGCGNFFPPDKLKKCTRCKRVHYCSKKCQSLDWKGKRLHAKSCQPGLLEHAMNNLPLLSMEQKIQLGGFEMGSEDNHVPNKNINQTINKVSCVSVSELLDVAEKELSRIKILSSMTTDEVADMPRPNRLEHVNYRHGLDDGVETLCLALNLWPGVATVNSCSGLHRCAWLQPTEGNWINGEHFVTYVCDDAEIIMKISKIIQAGILGVYLLATCGGEYRDGVGGVDGFATIDYLSPNGKIKICRSMCRQIKLHDSLPFDKIDAAVWNHSLMNSEPPFMRHQYALVGCLALGLKLVSEAPHLDLTPQEVEKIDQLMKAARDLRNIHIKNMGKIKDSIFEIAARQQRAKRSDNSGG